ncbi:tyrosinase [Podospora aff. communis PSN243]|uniref:Tyrosinase n=1 Tax=Podospora aff. communis PSN243 TaxID=3040156 RepID=A0AAV9GEE9_9PEZI|nr:tyrosinase [Podospora aff. communis PSN243]
MALLRGLLVVPALIARAQAMTDAEAAAIAGTYADHIKIQRNPAYPLDEVDLAEIELRPKVEAFLAKKVQQGKNNNCTLANAGVRREWADLSIEEREEYVAAVNCLMKLPPQAPKDRFPGALSRFDDFVAYHMTHAMELHDNYHLFPAHKHFIWAFEQALRNECGYKGYQPYMNYDRIAKDLTTNPANSPHWNGNSSSLGGNGEPDPEYKGVGMGTRIMINPAGGGGCVKSGPFSECNPKSDGTGSNPRCLRRDINKDAALGATADRAYKLLTESKDINTFYNTLLGTPRNQSDPYGFGIHTAGHYIHAVDPGGDAGTSPGDPGFYFHHGALDRLWWMWQMQDPEERLNAVPMYGKVIPMDHGAHGAKVKHKRQRETDPNKMVMDMQWLSPLKSPLMEAHDQLGSNGGAYCYIYI